MRGTLAKPLRVLALNESQIRALGVALSHISELHGLYYLPCAHVCVRNESVVPVCDRGL